MCERMGQVEAPIAELPPCSGVTQTAQYCVSSGGFPLRGFLLHHHSEPLDFAVAQAPVSAQADDVKRSRFPAE